MKNKIKLKVDSLVTEYNTSNPFELCSYLEIPILYSDLGQVNGICQNAYGMVIIHINSMLNYNDQLVTCAHELGHALLHNKENIVFLENNTHFLKNKYENEANFFAVELLLKKYANYILDISADTTLTIEKVSLMTGIPINYLWLKFN